MDKIVPHVFQVCVDIGLITCTINLDKKDSIIWNLHQAWELFQKDPTQLREIEEKSL